MNTKLIGGILLVSGTAIGAAMLALPVSTGMAGFLPSALLFLCSWLLMTYTAFLILEVNLWMGKGANMISMARRTLGWPGEIFAWVCYLFLLYTLTTAYLAVGGPLFLEGVSALTGFSLPHWLGPVPLLLIFSFTVYRGTAAVDYTNRLLMVGMGISYLALCFLITPHMETKLLTRTEWPFLLLGVSVVATSFGFHIIIPTLYTYLQGDVRSLIRALLIGSLIPLTVYLSWEAFTLSIIPIEGPNGILNGYLSGANGASLLAETLNYPCIHLIAHLFLLCAILTSFLGVSLSLWDFFSDGLNIPQQGGGRTLLYLLTFAPPLAFTLTHSRAFLTAIEYAGAFGVVTLLGLLPAFMIWRGRYRLGFQSPEFRAPGGRLMLLLVIAASICVIAIELCHKLGVFHVNALIETLP